MKKLHLFVIKTYTGPLISTFFVVVFILLMQFLWKYIDDLIGKGLEFSVIAELLLIYICRAGSSCPASCHIIILTYDLRQPG
jgi:lipopolysaccharide export LptBFGC system permease protein LptF